MLHTRQHTVKKRFISVILPIFVQNVTLRYMNKSFKTRTVGLQQRAPPNAQQQKGDIRSGENLDNHSSDETHIQT